MHGRRLATTEELIAIASPDSDEALATLEAWTDERGIGFESVPVGDSIADVYDPDRVTLGVTLGGDGTFLEGVKEFAPRAVPMLGVNTGTLAFLARVEPDDVEAALSEVYSGRATVDTRQQLRAVGGGVDATGINDVMVRHVPPENPTDRKVTRLHVYADDEYVGQYEGTGVAIATPTGSTGVALSADGPVHYPRNNHTLQIVPLHTHQMGVRPVVVDADAEIRVVPEEPASLLVDGGRAHETLSADEEVLVTGAAQSAHVIKTSYDEEFFSAVASKLGWGARGATDAGPEPEIVGGDTAAAATERPDVAPERDDAETIERALAVGIEAARSAGEALRELHGQVEQIEFKSDKADIVTEADYRSEQIIEAAIETEFPEHGIRSEESVAREGSGAYTWLVDPLDGTGNFAHGNPNYSVSIALLRGDEPVMGVVYAPESDELFTAVAGGEAYENGSPIATTDRGALDESMLLSGYDPDGTFLTRFYQQARGVRRLGSAALNLCYLASGTADAVWEYDTYPWDVAAGLVIARAAGASITNTDGEAFDLALAGTDDRTELLGSNGPLHDRLLEEVADEDELHQPPAAADD
ncbi:MAG: inositol monophosphatase family protein [Haloarculaceae archaeon]